MPLQLGSRTAVLDGIVTVEDAEPLTAWLRVTPRPRVNLRDCTHLHTAALQALLVAGARISVPPLDGFLLASAMPSLLPPLLPPLLSPNADPEQDAA